MRVAVENPSRLAFPATTLAALDPPARQTPSEWAAANFYIMERGAVRPGLYELDWTPYWREPLDAIGDPSVRRINVVASAQTGKTQMGNAATAYIARFAPANMLYVRPGESDVKEAFSHRFEPMIRANLSEYIQPRKDWINVSRNPSIALQNMIIYGAAATVPRQLTSRTCAHVWYDETDSGGDTGNDLGNVLDVIEERQMAFSSMRSKTLGTSTPKYDTGSNWIAYDRSSDRRVYFEPCPFCGEYFLLTIRHLTTQDGERDPDAIRSERLGRAKCDHCKEKIPDQWQAWMSDRGVWVASGERIAESLPDDDDIRERAVTTLPADQRWEPRKEGESIRPSHRGYQVWRAQTKFDQCSWSNILARWLEVTEIRDPERLQVFINNWMAEPWKETVAPANPEIVESRIGVYEPRVVPDRAKALLGYCDVQQDCVWYLFRAFGPDMESWLIDYGSIEVSMDNYPATFDRLYETMRAGWPVKGGDGLRMRAYALAVDSGYRPDEVYEFARRPGVIATKGRDIADYRIRVSQVEGKKRPDPVTLYHVNTKAFKDRLQRLIKTADDEAGGWHLHCETTPEYVAQLTAEHLKGRKSNPKIKTWQPITDGRPNHLLDCEAGVLALAEALEQRGELSLLAMTTNAPQHGLHRGDGRSLGGGAKARPKRRQRGGGWLDGKPDW